MRKLSFILLLATAALTVSAGTPERLFGKFKNEKNAEYVHIPRFLMGLCKTFYKDEHDGESESRLAKSINSIKVLDLGDCGDNVHRRFRDEVKQLSSTGYEPLLQVSDGEGGVRLLLKQHGDVIKEIFVIATAPGDCAMVQIKGSIRPYDINSLVGKYTKK